MQIGGACRQVATNRVDMVHHNAFGAGGTFGACGRASDFFREVVSVAVHKSYVNDF